MSLGELTEAAGVSVRTVRYYIAEGLLPPPEGSGPGSSYSPGHLDRLRLIQRLKAAYLPLKEIRRQTAGLRDAEVREILMRDAAAGGRDEAGPGAQMDPCLAGARNALALMESRARYRTEPMPLGFPSPPVPASDDAAGADWRAGRADQHTTRRWSAPDTGEATGSDEGLWRRIPLGGEAELVISDRVYTRHRDRIDWLVRWARKVFD